MANEKKALETAIRRSEINGDTVVNFNDPNEEVPTLRHFDDKVVGEGTYKLPKPLELRRSARMNKAGYFFTADGTPVYCGMFTRRAVAADGSGAVCSDGTAVDAVQKCDGWQDALKVLEGKTIKIVKKAVVTTAKYGEQKVWTINFEKK